MFIYYTAQNNLTETKEILFGYMYIYPYIQLLRQKIVVVFFWLCIFFNFIIFASCPVDNSGFLILYINDIMTRKIIVKLADDSMHCTNEKVSES